MTVQLTFLFSRCSACSWGSKKSIKDNLSEVVLLVEPMLLHLQQVLCVLQHWSILVSAKLRDFRPPPVYSPRHGSCASLRRESE